MAEKESFSFTKFFSGFTALTGYAKAIALTLRIVLILCVPGSYMLTYHFGFKGGKVLGDQQGYSRAIQEHPPVTINGNGAQVNQNVCPKITKVGVTLGPLGFLGWTK